mmetsp:Transcript_1611/g.2452  ORF Transcript_1611/g.2452 Transcript_1611/m.2452 type:complete len:450 (+) Transcript_1611:445-1794(+)
MRLGPGSSSKYDLYLLSSGKGGDAVMGSKFAVQSYGLKVSLCVSSCKNTGERTFRSSLATINVIKKLLESKLLKLLAREPTVHVLTFVHPLYFVFEDFTLLATSKDLFNDSLLLDQFSIFVLNLDLNRLLHFLLFFFGDLYGGLYKCLLIGTIRTKTPLQVLNSGLVQMLLDMMERMLCNICEVTVWMLVDRTLVWLQFTSQKFDHGRFSCSVSTDACNTRSHGNTDGNSLKLWFWCTWVCKTNISHGKNWTSTTLYTIKRRWGWELECQGRCGKIVVCLCMRESLNKLGQVTLVVVQLQGVKVDDMSSHVVQKLGVVRYNQGSYVGANIPGQVVNNPLYVQYIQVICWFIKKKNISLAKHSTSKCEFHLPTPRERSDWHILHLVGKPDLVKSISNFLAANAHLFLNGTESKVGNTHTSLTCLDIVVNKYGLELVDWKSLNLSLCNGLQ